MPEVMEVPEVPEGHRENPLTIPVAVTMSILAVLVAIATLLGHRASVEELVFQTQASDHWAYFQAKNIRSHEVQSVADILGALTPVEKEKTEALRGKYLKEVERYEMDKDEISEQAKELEKERDLAGHREDRFDAGEVILEIGLIVCSLTLLTNKRIFWFAGIGLGAVGLCVMLTGFLLH
jgi:Domain of unknown function (DUF4337)